MKLALFVLCLGATVLTVRAHTLVAANSVSIKRGSQPTGPSDNWDARAVLMGNSGWDAYSFIMISPCGIWYAVLNNKLYTAYAPGIPSAAADNWIGRAQQVGNNDWDQYKFVFFAHTGDLYAISSSTGAFYTRYVPLVAGDPWQAQATTLGDSGWNQFSIVMFEPITGDIIAYENKKMYKGAAPTSTNKQTGNQWKASATLIGTLPIDAVDKLFFDRSGVMFMVDKLGGFWQANAVTNGQFSASTGATKIGNGWQNYSFMFFRL